MLFVQHLGIFVFESALIYSVGLTSCHSNLFEWRDMVDWNDGSFYPYSKGDDILSCAASLSYGLFVTIMPVLTTLHVLMLLVCFLKERQSRRIFLERLMNSYRQDKIIEHKAKNEGVQRRLLEHVLPERIVKRLEGHDAEDASSLDLERSGFSGALRSLSMHHESAVIMFADVVRFKELTHVADSHTVMEYLNKLFQSFDGMCDGHGVFKVETVGSEYVACVGVITGEMLNRAVSLTSSMSASLPSASKREGVLAASTTSMGESDANVRKSAAASNCADMIAFAKAIIQRAGKMTMPLLGCPTQLRIGIHVGPCMSGIVGTRNLRFCLFGDTMNTAARMKQMGAPKAIHVTEDVVALAPDDAWEARELEVKGKGRMTTYVQELSVHAMERASRVRGGLRGSSEEREVEEEISMIRSQTLDLVRRIEDRDK